ncbi:MAG: hypothetical protein RMK57_17015 [Bryobacterales bacterium]|nr:hypothetical protein [Bryobacterales bacterium]
MLAGRFEEELARYKQRREQLGRDLVVRVLRRWYSSLLALISVVAVALNLQSLGVFQGSVLPTGLMALTVGVLASAGAHFCGIWVKQWPGPAWAARLKVTVAVPGTLGCLVGLNQTRAVYLRSVNVSLGPGDEILQQTFLLINTRASVGESDPR